jgi:tetratricopeptide (TPR) repeat protein
VDPTQALEQQAVDFARRGDFGPDAKRANEELTKVAPDNPGAWTRLARCCMTIGQLDAATEALEAALALNPQNTIASSLQLEVSRQRIKLAAAIPAPKKPRAAPAKRRDRADKPLIGGFGRPEFAALGQVPPEIAVETLGPRIEAVLMALNERSFGEKVVEARNRAARSGGRVFRRNSFYPGGAGHIYAFQHGGRWEPQLHVGIFAAPQWQRDSLCAGLGFNLSPADAEQDAEVGQERALAYFDRFQQLVSSDWRQLLTDWMTANGGFIQYGDNPPETNLLPKDAVASLITEGKAREAGRVFCGRWLFADRSDDAATLADAAKLTRWIEQTFTDLLPLWMSVYRK